MARECVTINIDGASQGNPGPAGVGVVFHLKDDKIEISRYIGKTTNNVAEYVALLYALQEALMRGYTKVLIHTDSLLLAQQIMGNYRVRDANLKILFGLVMHLKEAFGHFEIAHAERATNKEADKLATEAIRESGSGGRSQMFFGFEGGKSELHRAA